MAKPAYLLKRARAELIHAEKQLARLEARLAIKRAEVARLHADVERFTIAATEEVPPREDPLPAPRSSGSPRTGALPDRRTDAILQILRDRAVPMTPSEINAELRAAGRDEQLRSVTATLAHLRKSDAVSRVGRGLYVVS